MGFGKSIVAEVLDLFEATFGIIEFIALADHAVDELFAEPADRTHAPERCHRPAQLIGFRRWEPGTDYRDLHRLLLKQRHAIGFLQHVAQLLGGIIDALFAVTAPQIRMNHVALDRTGTYDRDLDDQIVELARLEARQHRHLSPAFNLEHAHRIGQTQHVVDLGIFRWHIRQG